MISMRDASVVYDNGVRALNRSADLSMGDDDSSPMSRWQVAFTLLMALGAAIVLFVAAPHLLAMGMERLGLSGGMKGLSFHLWDGVFKFLMFIGYIAAISFMPDIRRVFQYHGAEHKTIFCYEAGLPLTVENVRKQPKHHPRCGTSFLFVVIFVSIIVSSIFFGIWPMTNAFLRTLVHLLLLPLVVGITYEFNRWVGRHVQEGGIAKILTAPGMWMQNFTTNEPDDSMIEVAIRSLELVLPKEKGKDEW